MPEPISILEVIRRGGYEASLLTTFNAHLPFYEEVVLRKLVGAGCRHNVVLMDRNQCGISWASEATRPRLAGHAYTLVPIGVSGAFHPKLCLLVGPKKAAILVGSHNLTLSGFGYNREITNWVDVVGDKDSQGSAVLGEAWRAASGWIELERGRSPDSLIDSALALARFIGPLSGEVSAPGSATILSQSMDDKSLLEQLVSQLPTSIHRIGVLGAFFDAELALLKALASRWPQADIVVGVDPETVHCSRMPTGIPARFVDARTLWKDEQKSYLHAKAIYFDAGEEQSAFASGSANPSRPAWMGKPSAANVEAILVRRGREAMDVASSTGVVGLFALPSINDEVLSRMSVRSSMEASENSETAIPLLVGVAEHKIGEIRISVRGKRLEVDSVELCGLDSMAIGSLPVSALADGSIIFRWDKGLQSVRSCRLLLSGELVGRVLVHHPEIIAASAQSTRQYQIKTALGALGSSDADISSVIASVEKVIFSDDTHKQVSLAVREQRDAPDPKMAPRPESLAISITELPREARKIRLLKSGDLAYLLDVLLRRLGEGLETGNEETDKAGRTEEEQVGQEDDDPQKTHVVAEEHPSVGDAEIARAVARKARQLIRRMVAQLERAAKLADTWPTAVLQLVAVLALLRELRHLDKSPRWRKTGQLLVDTIDRRYLLDHAIKHLLGSSSRLLNQMSTIVPHRTDEEAQLKVLLLWLAWDLGDELTDQIGRMLDQSEVDAQLRANAVFLELIPPLVGDAESQADLQRCVEHTLRPTPQDALRAKEWLGRLWKFGAGWAGGYDAASSLRIGGYAYVPGVIDEPRVVLHVSGEFVGLWDFDRVRQFQSQRVKPIRPIPRVTSAA